MIGDQPLEQLEMIDNLQRLGVAYHFDNEINNILWNVYKNSNDQMKKDNLYATASEFRLLRQHGYHSSSGSICSIILVWGALVITGFAQFAEVFDGFRDKTGEFMLSLCNDIKAMVSLYDASYFCFEGESIMEAVWEFTSKNFRYVERDHVDPILTIHVSMPWSFHYTGECRGLKQGGTSMYTKDKRI